MSGGDCVDSATLAPGWYVRVCGPATAVTPVSSELPLAGSTMSYVVTGVGVELSTWKRISNDFGLPAAPHAAWSFTTPFVTMPVPTFVAFAAVSNVPLPLRMRWKMSDPAKLTGRSRDGATWIRRWPWSPL